MTDKQLSALLRFKRYEQPPAQYFDRLLQEIHARQRAELLQRPLWRIAAERMRTFFSEHSMGHLSYVGALATVLVIGVVSIGLLTPAVENSAPSTPLASHPSATPAGSSSPETRLSLAQTSPPQPVLESPSLPTAQSGYEPVISQPRYVIDARPVSYEPSASINF